MVVLGEASDQFDEHVLSHIEMYPMRMVATLCGDDPARWAVARRAVLDAVSARTRMWDGIVAGLPDDDLVVA